MAAFSSFHHLSNSSSSQYPNTAFFSSCVSQYYNEQQVMNNETCVFGVRNKNSTDSSSVVTHYTTPKTTKRKSQHHPPSPNCAQSKDMRQVIKGNKKQKKMKDSEENKAAPADYIHVRARRGQATDSHSLAERVRRERISERMKFLQALVPGCDKVTGKALMLDEIINYVQSLQNQVEFLSMKLAYVNPMFYDFGMDLESFRVEPEQSFSSLPSPLAAGMQQCSPTTSNTYTLLDNSLHLLQPPQIPNALSQGNRQVLWEVEEERHRVINESGNSSSTLFSFH